MNPERLSASAIATFETCEARYQATYIEKGREIGGAAANLGTTVHAWLEWLVSNGFHTSSDLKKVLPHFDKLASAAGLDARQIIDGQNMIKKWWKFHEENGFDEVISCESKETFTLTHPDYPPIEVTYIWDRADRRPDGNIQIVDYKTFGQPMSADTMRTKVQPRVYALSGQMKFKEMNPAGIWVTYWLMRFGEVGTFFTREDNIATWRYLQDVYGRIKESDGIEETINSECKWCVRKAVCSTLNAHTKVGGSIGLSTKEQAIRLAETKNRLTALKALADELEVLLVDSLDQEDALEQTYGNVRVWIKPTNKREADKERMAKVLGPDIMVKYGELSMTKFDEIMKHETLTDDQRLQLKRLVRNRPGAELKIDIATPFDDL